MIQETVKVNVSSPEVIENATIYVRKYNRTFDALNSTATFKVWLNDSIFVSKLIRSLKMILLFIGSILILQVHVKSYEWKANRYQRSFLDVKLDFCKFLANPAKTNVLFALFYTGPTKMGNFPKKCPVAPVSFSYALRLGRRGHFNYH